MKKVYLNETVYEMWLKRIEYISKRFDHIIIAFSGGKDSGILLHLFEEYYKLHQLNIKVSVYHLDYEGGYQHTFDYVEQCMRKNSSFEYYHLCMPVSASCGVSMYQSTWLPWDPEKEKIWVRKRPNFSINLDNHQFDFFQIGMSDYKFQTNFCRWLHNKRKANRTAILIGIRAQESLNRYYTITRNNHVTQFGTISYSRRVTHKIFNFYPLYDWKVEDIWTAYAQFRWPYNKLYDLFYYAGVPLHDMRVANPYHSCGVEALKLYKIIEPDSWVKLIGRVNGANFAAIYGGTKAVGHKKISLPKGHTWKSYTNFLLRSLPSETREIYIEKFKASKKYWLEKGGALPITLIKELEKTDLSFQILGLPNNNRNYTTEHRIVKFNEYPDDVKIKQFRLIPSYKRMCITLLKNDTSCRYMGFSQTKNELQLKKEACQKWHQLT